MKLPSLRSLALMLTLAIAAAFTVPGSVLAQSVNPTAESVREDTLLKALSEDGTISGRVSIPDPKAGNLIHPAGRDWRAFHEVTLPTVGGVALVGMLVLLAAFYALRGRIRIEGGRSTLTITRFNAFERFIHWLTALCFIALALSGLNLTFGKHLLLPLIGSVGFHYVSDVGKLIHNYLGFPFTLGLILMALVWLKDNIPTAVDLNWFAKGGGIIGRGHPPAAKFNGGQKVIYWSVILGGAAIVVSGFILLFPFYVTDMTGMQISQMVHGLAAVLLIAVMIAHIYIGSIGMEGAFDAMGSGEVDLNWAREHHSLWVAEEEKRHPESVHAGKAVPAE